MKKTISKYQIVRKPEQKKQEDKKEKQSTQMASYVSYYDLFKSLGK